MNAFMDSLSSIFAHISAHTQDVREFLNSVFVTSVAGPLQAPSLVLGARNGL
jgi:hypothetical protein